MKEHNKKYIQPKKKNIENQKQLAKPKKCTLVSVKRAIKFSKPTNTFSSKILQHIHNCFWCSDQSVESYLIIYNANFN